ncbi:MAG: protein-tyrosine-phosphatase [Bacteroidetes bacterium]|nr:MAG: protein-tyrosine-phosphatase [Bacteroidota bacterium]
MNPNELKPERPQVLVVCGKNKRRSRTAEYLFKNDRRFSIRSVGLSPKSERQIQARDAAWSDLILVMEDAHKSRIVQLYRDVNIAPIQVLHIDDVYEFQDPELIELLTDRINAAIDLYFEANV